MSSGRSDRICHQSDSCRFVLVVGGPLEWLSCLFDLIAIGHCFQLFGLVWSSRSTEIVATEATSFTNTHRLQIRVLLCVFHLLFLLRLCLCIRHCIAVRPSPICINNSPVADLLASQSLSAGELRPVGQQSHIRVWHSICNLHLCGSSVRFHHRSHWSHDHLVHHCYCSPLALLLLARHVPSVTSVHRHRVVWCWCGLWCLPASFVALCWSHR